MGQNVTKEAPTVIFTAGALLGLTIGYLVHAMRAIRRKDAEFEATNFSQGSNYRLILGIRNDLKMQKGKVAAQCGHAAVAAYVKASIKAPEALAKWARCGQAKIAVKIDDEEQMMELNKKAKRAGILTSIIRDAGHTQVAPDTRTVIAFGPAPKDEIDKLTGHLKLY